MLADMNNIYWPTGVALVAFLFLFTIGRAVDKFWERYQATRQMNVHLEEQAYDMAMKIVELETRVALTTAEAEVARRQLTHLTNAAVAMAHNRRIRRQDIVEADGFAHRFNVVQRRRLIVAETLERDLEELEQIRGSNSKDNEIIALTAMVREAIRMSREDPDFNVAPLPQGRPHEFDSHNDRQHRESVLYHSLDRSARFGGAIRSDSTGGPEA